MKERIHQINPDCEVHCVDDFVTPENWPGILPQGVNAVIDACDQIHAKTAMAAWALRQPGVVFIAVGAAGGTYTGSVTPSAATGGSFTVANYSITYVSGNIQVTTALAAGDLALIGINTSNPDTVGVLVLKDLTAGDTFNITDNGWLAAGGFRSGEGVLTYTVPSGGITKGTVLVWQN
jgi:hypothetical protein